MRTERLATRHRSEIPSAPRSTTAAGAGENEVSPADDADGPDDPAPRVVVVRSSRSTPHLLTAATAAALLLSACGIDAVVTAERSDSRAAPAPTSPPFQQTPADPATPDDPIAEPGTAAPDPTSPSTTTPAEPPSDPTGEPPTSDPGEDPAAPPTSTQPETSIPAADPPVTDPDAINFGDDKPVRDYDAFLLATLTDLEAWWAQAYPAVYGEPFSPLAGDVYAAYPERTDPLPGCGEPTTSYRDVQQFVAFYCGAGDFIVYDDGSDGLLFGLADRFGAGTIGIVLAHEYGHAIQERSGVLRRNLPTVATEQQADCFAGAWAGRAARGEGSVEFTDADVRAGLIAMLEVRDPVGLNQLSAGGHGSGFDRVGAFQEGFQSGPSRCADLIDNPLPLMPNQFTSLEDQRNEGNAAFGYESSQLLGFLPEDLNLFWDLDAAVENFDPITLVPVQSPADVNCADLRRGIDQGAAYCPSSNTVFLNEPVVLDLYRQRVFGDFSIGYLIGVAWADAVQVALGSTLTGEPRELVNDCLAGAWVKTVIPVDFTLPEPRNAERQSSVSPGDLDEAVRTVILIGDLRADDDVIGTPFEKVDAFRDGVLGGLDACAT